MNKVIFKLDFQHQIIKINFKCLLFLSITINKIIKQNGQHNNNFIDFDHFNNIHLIVSYLVS